MRVCRSCARDAGRSIGQHRHRDFGLDRPSGAARPAPGRSQRRRRLSAAAPGGAPDARHSHAAQAMRQQEPAAAPRDDRSVIGAPPHRGRRPRSRRPRQHQRARHAGRAGTGRTASTPPTADGAQQAPATATNRSNDSSTCAKRGNAVMRVGGRLPLAIPQLRQRQRVDDIRGRRPPRAPSPACPRRS